MSEKTETEVQKWRAETAHMLRKFVIGVVIAAVAAPLGIWATGAKDQILAIWNLPNAVEANGVAIQSNRDWIQRLRVPTEIFHISELSGPVHGGCFEGEDCEMLIRVRRYQDALACEILPRSVQYYYRNPRTNDVSYVDVVKGRPRDLGTSYVNLSFTFTTPFGLTPDAELCVEPEYVGCPGMQADSPPAKQAPECFNVTIFS